jgi:5'-3' exoribonuclease 1
MVGLSGRAVGKITSSFMVITSNGQKNNIGLSLKFEAKALKVIDYSRKDGRYWEFSEKAVELIRDYKVCLTIIHFRSTLTTSTIAQVSRYFPSIG